MSLESNARRNMVGVTILIRYVRWCAIISELIPNLEISQVWKIRSRPDSVAERVAIVASLVITGA
jgi:hypothetical protein